MKSPAFVIAAVLSLALGIGANTTIFTMVNSLFLQPMTVEKITELMHVYGADSANANSIFGSSMPISYGNYVDYRARSNGFVDMGAYSYPMPANLAGSEKATPIMAQLVSANYFRYSAFI